MVCSTFRVKGPLPLTERFNIILAPPTKNQSRRQRMALICFCFSEYSRSILFCSVLFWSGLVWSGLVWSGLVWSGLVWSGLVWSGLVWSHLPRTALEKVRKRLHGVLIVNLSPSLSIHFIRSPRIFVPSREKSPKVSARLLKFPQQRLATWG